MVKREIRTRPVDVYRKMPIMRVVDEYVESASDETLDRSNSLPASSSAALPAPSLERQTSTQQQVSAAPKAKAADIPTPIVEVVPDYDTNVEANFKVPTLYIRNKKPVASMAQQDESVEYNLELEDEEWLQRHRLFGAKGELEGVLSADLMERLMDELEKAQGTAMELMSALTAETAMAQSRLNFQAVGSNKQIVQEVYQYWVSKRQRYKKPLLRRFWPVTSINDTNPHLVFRPREKERYKLRKHRKNDMDSFRKMQTLKRDFDKVLHLMEMVKRRERLKHNLLLLHEEKFQQLLADMCHVARKPTIPRETPEIKFKIRLKVGPPQALPVVGSEERFSYKATSRRERLKRDRDDGDGEGGGGGGRRASQQQQLPESNPEQDRLKMSVGMGYKEREAVLPTPDYLPSFMEDLSLRALPLSEQERQLRPYSSDWASYSWRPLSSRKKKRLIGHTRAGVVSRPRCIPSEFSSFGWPSSDGEDDEEQQEEPGFTVKYRCRGRIGRGGRLIIDRVPLAPRCEDPNVQAYWDEHGGGPGGEGSRRQGGRHVVLSSGPDVKFLERYPSTDLHHNHDVFKYPIRFPEIADPVAADDGEEELLEPMAFALPPSQLIRQHHHLLANTPQQQQQLAPGGGPLAAPPPPPAHGGLDLDETDLLLSNSSNGGPQDDDQQQQAEGGDEMDDEDDEEEDPILASLDAAFGVLQPLTALPSRPLPHPSESLALLKFQIRV